MNEQIKLGVTKIIAINIDTPINEINISDLDALQRYSVNKPKNDEPAIWCCPGKRSVYSPTRIGFMDIDTTEGVDTVIENSETLFSECPSVVAMQKSYSGGLHIIILLAKDPIKDEDEWRRVLPVQSIIVTKMIDRLFGINYIKIQSKSGKSALDEHCKNWSQGLYVSGNEWKINKFPNSVKVNNSDLKKLNDWSCGWIMGKSTNYNKKYNGDYTNSELKLESDVLADYVIDYSGPKLTINEDYSVGEYRGNELRWRIGSLLYNICDGDTAKAKELAESLFNRTQKNRYNEWKNFYNKGVNTIVKDWFIGTFCKKKTANKPVLTEIAGIPIDEWKKCGYLI